MCRWLWRAWTWPSIFFSEDVELASRSIILRLPLWEPGEASQRLIRALARGMGLVEPNRLAEPDLAEPICTASHGVTGNFKRILHWSAKVAKSDGRSVIRRDDIDNALKRFPPYRLL